MTEIRIQFKKTKVEKISNPNIPANIKGLKLTISPLNLGDKLNKAYEKVPPSSSLKQIDIAFFDGAETAIYNDLLDDKKDRFWLSWEKEKVDLLVHGKDKFEESDTKAQIRFFPDFSESLEIFFKPQFAGVVKITSTSQDSPKPQDTPNNQGKIAELQVRINALEQKQSQNPNSNDSEQTKQELTRLKSELATLKAKQNQQQTDKNPQPNDFPYGMAIGGGIVIVILLLVIAFLYKKTKK